METKITKKNFYTALVSLGNHGPLAFTDVDGNEVTISGEQLVEWAEKEIAMLNAKGEKAKERAAAKRAEGDELLDVTYSVLTEEFTGIADITAKISGPDVSVAKVTNRLNTLVKEGRAVKGTVTIPGEEGTKTRNLVAYARHN